jgi:hypothetical protein
LFICSLIFHVSSHFFFESTLVVTWLKVTRAQSIFTPKGCFPFFREDGGHDTWIAALWRGKCCRLLSRVNLFKQIVTYKVAIFIVGLSTYSLSQETSIFDCICPIIAKGKQIVLETLTTLMLVMRAGLSKLSIDGLFYEPKAFFKRMRILHYTQPSLSKKLGLMALGSKKVQPNTTTNMSVMQLSIQDE